MPSSWKTAARWYHQAVGESGHYYHQHVILPQVKKVLGELNPSSILDLGCGQGVLARDLPARVNYVGVDSAPNLISAAKKLDRSPKHRYFVGDMTTPLNFLKSGFDVITLILSLQNCDQPGLVFKQIATSLHPQGHLLIVLNHPCFRIPRQSGWGSDPKTKIEYRYLNRYKSFLKIPVRIHPSLGDQSPIAWSYHFSLSDLFMWLRSAHLAATELQEWNSDKESQGAVAKAENLARSEFPLFLFLVASHV